MGFLIYLAISAVLFGVTGALVSRHRGGDGFLGFFVGALFGPFGVVWSYFIGDDDMRDERLIERGDRKLCPECYEVSRVKAVVCKDCGYDFTALDLKPVLRKQAS